jgi:hypothetical protein
MAYIGNQPAESFTSFATQEFSTSATTSYTLDHAVTNENEIALFVNNVRQQPGSGKAYTATGTALTLSAATASTDTMYCVFLGRALQTVTPVTNSITNAMLSENSQSQIFNNNFRNIIINGDMSIAQRATSETGITGAGYKTLDRFRLGGTVPGAWTWSQSTTVPTGQGFATSMKLECTTAEGSLASGDTMYFQHKIEGQNLQYLKKGTSSAESTTISFWVRSAKTGTYIVMLYDNDNNRHISKSYTISSADTWEKKTITFAGDTTGAFDNDNNKSLEIYIWLVAGANASSGTLATSWESLTEANQAVGQVNLADSTSNEWYITGVQLEAGTSATNFEFLPTDVNLKRCYRYYEVIVSGNTKVIAPAITYTASTAAGIINFKTTKRATPTLDAVTGSDYYEFFRAGATPEYSSFSIGDASVNLCYISGDSASNTTAGYAGYLQTNNASSFIAFDSEL